MEAGNSHWLCRFFYGFFLVLRLPREQRHGRPTRAQNTPSRARGPPSRAPMEHHTASDTRASSPDTTSSDILIDDPGRGAALVKRPWTPEEDALLIAAVHKYGAARWSMIATQLSTGRVGKQCRERWNNHLCPEVKKSEWSEEEDRAIMQGVAVLGTRWCEIVKAAPLVGRTDNAIKNRFYSLQRRMKARQCGGNRARRAQPGPGEEEEEEVPPPSHTDRVMAIATELAFATDEIERDRLIEQLTDGTPRAARRLRQDRRPWRRRPLLGADYGMRRRRPARWARGEGEDGCFDAPSPESLASQIAADLGGEGCAFTPYDGDDAAALLDDAAGADGSVLAPLASAAAAAAADTSRGGGKEYADEDEEVCPAVDEATAAALVPSVSAVADLLQLPVSPPGQPMAHAATSVVEGVAAAAAAAKSPSGDKDDASSTSTISPQEFVGGAGAVPSGDAWRIQPTAAPNHNRVLAPTAGPVLASTVAAEAFQTGKTLTERNPPSGASEAMPHPRPPRAAWAAPSCARALADSNATEPAKAAAAAAAAAAARGASQGAGAALLGGRQAYKAFLAPLRLPAEQLADVDSPKRMRTPSGASPGAAAALLQRSAAGALAADAAGGAAELCFSPASPMGELLSLSIFNDLFNEGGGDGAAKSRVRRRRVEPGHGADVVGDALGGVHPRLNWSAAAPLRAAGRANRVR